MQMKARHSHSHSLVSWQVCAAAAMCLPYTTCQWDCVWVCTLCTQCLKAYRGPDMCLQVCRKCICGYHQQPCVCACLCVCVCMCCSPGAGRGVVVTRDVAPGELLLCCHPLAAVTGGEVAQAGGHAGSSSSSSRGVQQRSLQRINAPTSQHPHLLSSPGCASPLPLLTSIPPHLTKPVCCCPCPSHAQVPSSSS